MIDRIDPAACRSHLQALLSDESTLLTRLAQQLVLEHELLVANDVEKLESAGDARQATVASLMRIEDDRTGLCRQLGRSADREGLAALLKWCDPEGSLATAYSQVAERAAQCRAQNDRNGALVSARLARVQNMLGMLNMGSLQSQTYGAPAGGPSNIRATPGRLLVTSA
jgi:flagellar biosynthesis/type III secretory pathway chaperone